MLLLFVTLFELTSFAQTPATADQQMLMRRQITDVSEKMESLICDFEQTKKLSILNEQILSKGKIYYLKNNRLRFEYFSPYSYIFILNDQKILFQTENSKNVVDVKSNRFFQEIAKIMLNGVNGSGLTDFKNFTVRYYWDEKKWDVIFVPLKKEMKQMFSSIKLTFNANDFMVDRIEMDEPNGDKTIMRLTNKKLNDKIEDTYFRIN